MSDEQPGSSFTGREKSPRRGKGQGWRKESVCNRETESKGKPAGAARRGMRVESSCSTTSRSRQGGFGGEKNNLTSCELLSLLLRAERCSVLWHLEPLHGECTSNFESYAWQDCS